MSDIVATPDVYDGAPRIDGTRMPVASVLSVLLSREGFRFVRRSYSHLSDEQIAAALRFALDAVEARRATDREVVGWRVRVAPGTYEQAKDRDGFTEKRGEARIYEDRAAATVAAADWVRFDWDAHVVRVTRKVKP